MKTRALLLSLILLFFVGMAHAADVTITFQWDVDTSGGWEKLNFYERVGSEPYDYNVKLFELPQTYDANGDSQPVTATITTTYPDGQSATKYFVVRAQSGVLESADSEEVQYTVDLRPMTAPVYTAVYNEAAQSIDFSWPTDADSRITKWTIWHRVQGEADWVALVEVDASGSTSVPLGDLFPAGQRTIREFTMVAYGPHGLSSPDGAITTITVNRVPPSGVINFRIQLTQ